MRTCALPGCDADISRLTSRQSTCCLQHGLELRKINHQRRKAGEPPLGYRAPREPRPPRCGKTSAVTPEVRQIATAPPPEPAPFPEAHLPRWEPGVPPAPTGTTGRYAKALWWPDTHLPFHDPRAVALALNILRRYQPDHLFLLGDVIDCSAFSRFPVDATNRLHYLQSELDEWHGLATAIREAAPFARRTYIRGNHEARLEKWLYGQPLIRTWKGLDLGHVLELTRHGFDPKVVDEVALCQGNLMVRHGSFLGGQVAGVAARKELQRSGTSGISGHTHAAAQYLQRDRTGLRVWIECGHLAANPQHYTTTVQNWHQAVTIGEVAVEGNDFFMELIPFRLSYRARLGNTEVTE